MFATASSDCAAPSLEAERVFGAEVGQTAARPDKLFECAASHSAHIEPPQLVTEARAGQTRGSAIYLIRLAERSVGAREGLGENLIEILNLGSSGGQTEPA